jgi:septal ring factor EnvC (AmiA/AmiB activator)
MKQIEELKAELSKDHYDIDLELCLSLIDDIEDDMIEIDKLEDQMDELKEELEESNEETEKLEDKISDYEENLTSECKTLEDVYKLEFFNNVLSKYTFTELEEIYNNYNKKEKKERLFFNNIITTIETLSKK